MIQKTGYFFLRNVRADGRTGVQVPLDWETTWAAMQHC